MRGIVFLLVVGLAAFAWYQHIELKRHRVRTDPAKAFAVMGKSLSKTGKRIARDAQEGFEETSDELGKKFGKIGEETDVKEEVAKAKRRAR